MFNKWLPWPFSDHFLNRSNCCTPICFSHLHVGKNLWNHDPVLFQNTFKVIAVMNTHYEAYGHHWSHIRILITVNARSNYSVNEIYNACLTDKDNNNISDTLWLHIVHKVQNKANEAG